MPKSIKLAGLAATALGLTALAHGQEGASVTDTQLEQFVNVQQSINEVRTGFSEATKGVEDPDKLKEIQTSAQADLDAVVAESPLSAEQINTIAAKIQQSDSMKARLRDVISQ